MNNFFEMKVLDKEGRVKYVVSADEVQRRHIDVLINHPEYFPAEKEYKKKDKINQDIELEVE